MTAGRCASGDLRCTGDPEHREPPAESPSAAGGILDREIGVLHGTEKLDHFTVLDRLVLVEWHGERIADTRARFARPVHCRDAFP